MMEAGRGEEALELLTYACDRVDLDACVLLAIESREGGRLPTDLERSIRILNGADVLHSAAATYQLGVAYREELGVARDLDRTAMQWERACASDYEPACYDLGILLTQGEVPIDGEKAGRAFMASCGMNNPAACLNVTSLIEYGLYTPPETHTIASLKARACSLGVQEACE